MIQGNFLVANNFIDIIDLHLVFIDLEKTYDRVSKEILWKALKKKGVRVTNIQAIMDMYEEVSTSGGHKAETRFSLNNRIVQRFNTKPLHFHLSFRCTYRTHICFLQMI